MHSTDGGRDPEGSSAGRIRETNLIVDRIARKQHGIVSRDQLSMSGVSDDAIRRRIRQGQLKRVYRGVFLVAGMTLTEKGRWMAALLSSGPSAALSHRTAAKVWGISTFESPIHVARLSGSRGGPRGVRLHHPRKLPAHEVTRRGVFRVTTIPRTLVDLASERNPRMLLDAFSASRRLKLLDPEACWRCITETPGRKGLVDLVALLEQFEPFERPPLSELQNRVLKLCLDGGLPKPETEYPLGDRILDFVWPEQMVILEVDGRAYHHDRFDEDRDRDLDHSALGYLTVRVTYRMIRDDPKGVIERLRQVLAKRTSSTRAPHF